MSRSLEMRRTPAMLLGLFGSVALVLSAIGIYGVLAFSVAQRSREFGIRQALGADRSIRPEAGVQTGSDDCGDWAGARARRRRGVTHFMQTMLFGVKNYDPVIFAGVTIILLVVAALACYMPALRATRVDPIVALRDA